MCYQVEVLEYNEDKAIVTVGESKFIAYHDTDTEVTEGFDDFEKHTDLNVLRSPPLNYRRTNF